MSRCVFEVRILGRSDEVVTVARASHCDGRNRDISGKEVEERKKERARGVLTQCVVCPRVTLSRYDEEAVPRDFGQSSAYYHTTEKNGGDVLKSCALWEEPGLGGRRCNGDFI